MNITLSGTKVSMDGHTLAFQKNNLVDSMVITVDTDETWQYKLDVKYPCKDSDGKELYNVIDLTRVGNTCTAILQASMLPFNGKYTMQLRGISGNKVYHTDTFDVWVKYSIDPGKVYDPVPSEFYQIEQAVTEQAANAKQSASNAAESAAKAEDAAVHSPIIGENGNWFVWDFTKSEYVDSGKPASTPPITTETAGKYLTNDGSKTEWTKIESNLFLINLIQGEPDSEGMPTYTVDKTFTEIKTACDAGKKVELIPPVDDFFPEIIGSAPFEVASVSPEGIEFRSIGASPIGIGSIPSWAFGGIPFGVIYVTISPDEKVSVIFPFSVDSDTGTPVWNMIQKLPQQYVVIVIDEMDGTLIASNTLAQLQIVMETYSMGASHIIGESSINAVYNGKFYYMSTKTPTSITFTTTTENGLETLTVSNDGKEGSEDVWTHEVASLGGGSDLSLGITGATVGQIAKITAVDTDGKPTAWEPVDMSGGETWELIAEIDFDVDSANDVSVWEYNNLPNYKELAYRKVGLVSSTETASGLSISINGSEFNFSSIHYAKKGEQSNGWGKILLFPFGWIHENSGSASLPTNHSFASLQVIYNAIPFDGDSITRVKLSNHPTYKIAGGKLSLYGRR